MGYSPWGQTLLKRLSMHTPLALHRPLLKHPEISVFGFTFLVPVLDMNSMRAGARSKHWPL